MYLLDGNFVLSQRFAVYELYGAPQPMELLALFNTHHSIDGRRFFPYIVNQERLDPLQNNLEQRQSTTQALTCQHL